MVLLPDFRSFEEMRAGLRQFRAQTGDANFGGTRAVVFGVARASSGSWSWHTIDGASFSPQLLSATTKKPTLARLVDAQACRAAG